SPYLPATVVAGILMVLLVLLTGGLHLDGVADVADGLGGGRDAAARLRIMKDSRVGAMGVVALILVLLLKYQALAAFPAGERTIALLLMPAAGRWL
ncbi:MAG TPA: adenosylcobinamide-GDP ribazoletransferase, partial [Desulfuromonas sp.]|nr:adenosylcobinamide-GDP ribazoletransferase [Desulfuromonas sp.]